MKLVIAVVAFMAITAAVTADEKYTTKYDNVDIDEILKSNRLFENYYKCLANEGKCTPDANELKKILPDALKTECAKCNEKQIYNTEKVIKFLIEKKPEQWKVLQKLYDPENIYTTKYRDDAQKRGIPV